MPTQTRNFGHSKFAKSNGFTSLNGCQHNIDSIVQKAAAELPPHAPAESPSEDWVVHFFEQCKHIGDEEMQSVWARILAGEIGQPGSFSMRTVATVKLMTKSDAEYFTALCTFAWLDAKKRLVVIRHADWVQVPVMRQIAVHHLVSLGLANYESVRGFWFVVRFCSSFRLRLNRSRNGVSWRSGAHAGWAGRSCHAD